jgi:hypothetical protein
MKHKHAELIKAWADGAEIESRRITGEWLPCDTPVWRMNIEYRIKPEPVKVVQYFVINNSFTLHVFSGNPNANLKLTLIDNVLVEAEVLKNAND